MDRHRLTELAGKRILITGHSGFLGSWVSVMATVLGASVSGYSLNRAGAERERAAWLESIGVPGLEGDVRDYPSLEKEVRHQDCDLILHFAAQPIVATGYRDPRGTLDVNINGTINVLEAARLVRPRGVIVLSSDKCYRNRSWRWPYRETDEIGGGCPYSVSKAAAELVLEAYAGLYTADPHPVGATSVRLGNLVGGGDFADRLAPNCLRDFSAGRAVRLRDSGAVRPWQHVLDVAHGIMILAAEMLQGRIRIGEAYNFAPPHEGATVRELANELARAWRTGIVSDEDEPGQFPEEHILRLDGRKAADDLQWKHQFDLAAMAREVVDWHRGTEQGIPPAEMAPSQVRRFLAQAGHQTLLPS
ncbi:CDP-glucose 4,6-dehydratase [Streptomyces sp. NPDC005283]|uniref:CDP-glucose 4,6-dehydratase n=1 Tax=Streptomyces sp. NPDC005283 TaxID=3156871 RepID=UPI003456E160